jgi:two-component system chemotaxis response regulator CheB
MAKKDIVVIGTSSGGIEALKSLVSQLPAELEAAIFVVLHTSADAPGLLPLILERAGTLPAVNARDGEPIKTGCIYVAPPDRHLLIERGHVRVTRGPKENRFRPAIDPLFRSAAYIYGPRVIGVVLTGNLDDGTAGLWAIKHRGGTAIVQDPYEALFRSMPQSALANVEVDHCVPIVKMAPLISELSRTEVKEGVAVMGEEMKIEVNIAAEEEAIAAGVQKLGQPSSFACPECHGVLLKLDERGHPRFRCHTGHAYSMDSLLAESSEVAEDTLWSAIRTLEEGVLLMREAAQQLREQGREEEASGMLQRAEETRRRAESVRQAVSERDVRVPAVAGVRS